MDQSRRCQRAHWEHYRPHCRNTQLLGEFPEARSALRDLASWVANRGQMLADALLGAQQFRQSTSDYTQALALDLRYEGAGTPKSHRFHSEYCYVIPLSPYPGLDQQTRSTIGEECHRLHMLISADIQRVIAPLLITVRPAMPGAFPRIMVVASHVLGRELSVQDWTLSLQRALGGHDWY